MLLPVRRRSRLVATSISLAVCLLIWYTRPNLRTLDYATLSRSLLTVPSSLRQIESESGDLGQRPGEWNDQAQRHVSTSLSPAPVIPLIIFAFNRADNLRLTIDSVLSCPSYSPSLHPIFISQDGTNASVTAVIQSYGDRVRHLQFQWPGETRENEKFLRAPKLMYYQESEPPPVIPYLKIADHYKFALTQVMDHVEGHKDWNRVIMLEDDMYIAPDFFSYFRRLSPLFNMDASLYCVSAWNDHGQKHFVNDTKALYRTDCFPGLGWMWSRDRWEEFRKWTPGWWDDWLRESKQRRGRSCVFPEVSRVYTFGREGTSGGHLYEGWLKHMRLNKEHVEWEEMDVEYLRQDRYDAWLNERLRSAVRVEGVEKAKMTIEHDLAGWREAKEMLVEYSGLLDVSILMARAGLLYEHKSEIPRSSYRGVLQFRYGGIRIWLVPKGSSLASGWE